MSRILRSQLLFAAKAGALGVLAALVYTYFPGHWFAPADTVEIRHSSHTTDASSGADLRRGPVSYHDAVAAAAPAVVNIRTVSQVRQPPGPDSPLFEELFGDRSGSSVPHNLSTSLGSGVIISSAGYILTNDHLIADADEINVMLQDGMDYRARVIGNDPETDLAVLRIDATGLPAITLAAANSLRVGDVVLAIGNSIGVGQAVTLGIVSATGRNRLGLNTFEDFIQTDAAINPGNSGGALINPRGELVGINTAIFSPSGGSQGIGFAIPVHLAQDVTEQIIRHGRVIRGWLGVEARDPNARLRRQLALPEQGVLVTGVFDNGPAARAGLRAGDVLTEVDGAAITDSRTLLDVTTRAAPGSEVEVRGLRDGEPIAARARLVQRPLRR